MLQLISISADQAVGFLAQPPKDTAFGDEHGIGADAQLGRGLRCRQAVDGLALKGVPGRRRKLRLDHFQKPAQDEFIVLFVPHPCNLAGRVFELVELLGDGLGGG